MHEKGGQWDLTTIKKGVNGIFCEAEKGGQWDRKMQKRGVITAEDRYHVQVWKYPPRGYSINSIANVSDLRTHHLHKH